MDADDNKTKSITMLVRVLVPFTLIIIVLSVGYVLNWYYQEIIPPDGAPKPFVCRTCEDLRNVREQTINLYGVDGSKLFMANCSSCHTVTDKPSIGPGLNGVLGRIPSGDWKYGWIRNSDSTIGSGDAYAVMIHSKYKTHCMHFPKLLDNDIDAILGYCSASPGMY